jgi:hypothetical protein
VAGRAWLPSVRGVGFGAGGGRLEQTNQAGTDNLKMMNCELACSSGARVLPDGQNAEGAMFGLIRRFALPNLEVSSEAHDFSPVRTILQVFSRFFTPFFSCKGLVFRRLGKIPGYKRCRGQKMKWENVKTGVFIGRRRRAESMNREIFQQARARSSQLRQRTIGARRDDLTNKKRQAGQAAKFVPGLSGLSRLVPHPVFFGKKRDRAGGACTNWEDPGGLKSGRHNTIKHNKTR